MRKTFRIARSLKYTYRVNTILYALRQIPLVRRVLPQKLYQVRGLKILAAIVSVFIDLFEIFGLKAIYFLVMVSGPGILSPQAATPDAWVHTLLFLTIIGTYLNTGLFNPTRDKYYAMILLRMDARLYTLTDYTETLLSQAIGFLPWCLLFGSARDVPVWICLSVPGCMALGKVAVAGWTLLHYERTGQLFNENRQGRRRMILTAVLLVIAYGLPLQGIALPATVSGLAFLTMALLGLTSLVEVWNFPYYRQANQELLAQEMYAAAEVTSAVQDSMRDKITLEEGAGSHRRGFEYLNELFIKRHRKLLWRSTWRITAACAACVVLALGLVLFVPPTRSHVNDVILHTLPWFTFLMYLINRGTGFTQALFMNCDRSLLTYSFYKEPRHILRLFRIRLREIVKINAVPALVIGTGLAAVLWASGGTDNPVHYLVLVVSILAMSVFFSIHYLTIYYLLQPYNAATEVKSALYQVIMGGTYLVCLSFINLRLPTMLFGLACIGFSLLYSVAAGLLVYRLAPKTFRIRH